ncbi:AraC family transcriptional regulator [Streptacidiphilus jiangxiensis]|uniref:AraC-type DNA-binding protein n=1 Tax=Streptacidiphilus jiangxiensis TaxID=235985 RepID=A0A1H8A006_STRJI|nr:AraC family transcriptional regulator [Streptacidiphilus jiangxiensis]SEM63284.1 AraC-type DNA-binding protein [Streptacidiphilus jiangxiensis]
MADPGRPHVVDIGYDNPDQPRLGLEVFSFATLRRRLRPSVAAASSRPDFHQLTLVTRGEGTAWIDFVAHACAPGTLLHVRPGQVQRFPLDSRGEIADLEATLVVFTPAFPPPVPAATAVTDEAFGPAAFSLLSLSPAEHRGIAGAVAELAAEYEALSVRDASQTELTVELLRQLLAALLLRIARLPQADAGEAAAGGEVFRAFRAELERAFATRRHAAQYAATLGYSPRTLMRACLAATGRTAKDLIDDRVALEAKRLLVHTDLPVASVARMLGFTEPANFGKFFARTVGTTPGTFRATQR